MSEGMDRFFKRPAEDPEEDDGRTPVAVEVVITEDADVASATIGAQEIDGTKFFYPDCRWSPRLNLDGSVRIPERGDTGLLIMSSVDNPWIVEWWPYG